MKKLRSTLWSLLAGVSLAGAQVTTTPHNGPLAADRGIHLGAAVTFPSTSSVVPHYDTVLANEFNTAVCENAMKFGSIEATRNKFTWAPADAIVNFAAAHGMYMRGHNLLWYQQAGFLANLTTANTPRDTFIAIIRNHTDSVVSRYKGRIYEWDVVNEAIDESQSDGNRRSFLYTLNGNSNSYIDSEFVWAHQMDSSANLVYNDYNAEGSSTGNGSVAKSNFVYALVSGLKSRGIPINGVGFQCHLTAYDTAAIGANMSRLEALGLTISITEMDVSITSATDTAQLNKQAGFYQSMMALCLRHPGCKTFLTWGITDASSWHASQYPLTFTGGTSATPAITPKTGYYSIQNALLAAPSNPLPPSTSGGAPVGVFQVQRERPGVLRPAGMNARGVLLFQNAQGRTFDLQGRNLPAALPLPGGI